jgi:uncharacterized membrane-anchored protein
VRSILPLVVAVACEPGSSSVSLSLGSTFQTRSKRYHPAIYWTVILSTSTAGTTMSDYMDRTLGLGYTKGAALLITILSCVFAAWRLTTGSLSVDNVKTRKAELFYWIAILFSNTLGTALGDFLADSSGLGFLGGAFLVGGLLALVLLATFLTRLSRVLLFWFAFVLTRPFGATVGDVLTKSKAKGGLNFGTIGSSAILAGILVLFVIWSMVKERRGRSVAISV